MFILVTYYIEAIMKNKYSSRDLDMKETKCLNSDLITMKKLRNVSRGPDPLFFYSKMSFGDYDYTVTDLFV